MPFRLDSNKNNTSVPTYADSINQLPDDVSQTHWLKLAELPLVLLSNSFSAALKVNAN